MRHATPARRIHAIEPDVHCAFAASHPAFFLRPSMSAISTAVWNDVQWTASALGIVGALTNSLGGRLLRLTWPIWLCSNLLAIAALWRMNAYGFLAQQTFYLLTSLLGGFREFCPRQWRSFYGAIDALRLALVPIALSLSRHHGSKGRKAAIPLDYEQWLNEVDRLAWEQWAERDYTLRNGAYDAENAWAKAYVAGLSPAVVWAGEVRAVF
jgi:hypothetical protein